MEGYCGAAIGHPWHGPYHDEEYGFPVREESLLFERLMLEINQAGLAWLTILKKRDGLRRAYAAFDVDQVAAFDEDDVARLLADASVIRNGLKVRAAIENARAVVALREHFGSFAEWLDAHHPRPLSEWLPLFKKTFRFTGGEITREFLVSTGYLSGAHVADCPVYPRVVDAAPPWLDTSLGGS